MLCTEVLFHIQHIVLFFLSCFLTLKLFFFQPPVCNLTLEAILYYFFLFFYCRSPNIKIVIECFPTTDNSKSVKLFDLQPNKNSKNWFNLVSV